MGCPSRSASQRLISDCRVTPSRRASRSRESTIHAGKSTLTRFASAPMRFAFPRSSTSTTDSPQSNFQSNVLALINCHLIVPGAPDGNQANRVATPSNCRRPKFFTDLPNQQPARLIRSPSRNLQQRVPALKLRFMRDGRRCGICDRRQIADAPIFPCWRSRAGARARLGPGFAGIPRCRPIPGRRR